MRSLDFSSWQAVLTTLLGIVVVSLVAVGVRLLVMQGIQQRRERQNRQINERLKTLIAAYKTLGGSFTGDLAVDPSHLRELRLQAALAQAAVERAEVLAAVPDGGAEPVQESGAATLPGPAPVAGATADTGSERRRRIRDAVEAALSDVILLGTQAQVRLAVRAAQDMVAGRSIETAELVVALRDFIREVLDLEPMPADLPVPRQGPLRAGGGGGGRGATGGAAGGGGRGGGGGGGGGGGMAGGMGMAGGVGIATGAPAARPGSASAVQEPDDRVP